MPTTREVIDRYYECVNHGAWDEWLTLFSDDVIGDDQLGRVEGIDGFRGAIGAISYGYSRFQMTPLHVIVQDDEAVVIWRCNAANRAGTSIAYNYLPNREVVGANYFRLKGCKIAYMRTIHDETAFAPYSHPTNPKAPPT